jgi:hypothetical protein
MITKEQLKYCEICKNRKLDFEKGLLCGLTNEHATFTDTCSSFELDEYQNKKTVERKTNYSNNQPIPFGTIISIIIAIIAVIRLFVAFSNYNKKSNNNNINFDESEVIQQMIVEQKEQSKYMDQMSLVDSETKDELGIISIQKDSLLSLDKNIKFLLPSNYYIMNNLTNESMLFVGRDNKNSNIVIYKIKKYKNETADYAWYVYRKPIANEVIKYNLSTTKTENNNFFYVLQNSAITINGFAHVFEKDGYWYICQLENSHDLKHIIQSNSSKLFSNNIKLN